LTSNGTAWVSQALSGGTGTVTSVATSGGLTGGTITTTGTLSINTNNTTGVGSYAFIVNNAGGTINGATASGGSVNYGYGNGSGSFTDSGNVVSGTWRNIGGVSVGTSNFFLGIRTA
jgi:hypothetical protein